MQHEVIVLSKEKNVTLTTYINDLSPEMNTLDIRPGILIFPGGGYQFCSDREAEIIALNYMAKGYNAFVLRYSLNEYSKFPGPLNDAEDALEMIRDNEIEWRTNPEKIAVIGFSAGGHLAAMLSTNGRIRPNAQILGYPAIIRSDKHGWSYPSPGLDKEVDQLTPEAFVFHTNSDKVVINDHPLEYVNALNKSNIPFEIHIFRTGPHGLSLGNDIVANKDENWVQERYQAWFELSITWLNEVLKPFN